MSTWAKTLKRAPQMGLFFQIHCYLQCICICGPQASFFFFFFLPFWSVLFAQLAEVGEQTCVQMQMNVIIPTPPHPTPPPHETSCCVALNMCASPRETSCGVASNMCPSPRQTSCCVASNMCANANERHHPHPTPPHPHMKHPVA